MFVSKTIELFYLFFQGVIVFQAFFLGILWVITKRKDILYYATFLLLSAIYFFLNAPNTFFGLNDNDIFSSAIYLQGNIPLIILTNLVYVLFLKSFFSEIYQSSLLDRIFLFTLLLTPLLVLSFFVCRYFEIETQPIFYIVNFLTAGVSIFIVSSVFRYRMPNTGWVAWGMVFNILGTGITIWMIVLERYGVRNTLTFGYPLVFMRLGILADMLFYQVALLKKWHFQEKELAIQQLKSQLAVEKVRNQISRELHDDIGSTLSGISMYSHLATDQIKRADYTAVQKSLFVMQENASDTVNKLNDIVWLANPDEDSLQKLMKRLQQYAINMAAIKNMEVKVKSIQLSDSNSFSIASRRNIYLVCKEAINNAVKYSQATWIELEVQQGDRQLEITISDNGQGFDFEKVQKGNGLINMQERAYELGADLSISSTMGEGCIISLKIKVA